MQYSCPDVFVPLVPDMQFASESVGCPLMVGPKGSFARRRAPQSVRGAVLTLLHFRLPGPAGAGPTQAVVVGGFVEVGVAGHACCGIVSWVKGRWRGGRGEGGRRT